MKVKTLGRKHSYSHKYNAALNTTSNFGTLQPIFSRVLAKGDKVSITPNIVTRCAPMVAPAMANFDTHIRATFVPYADIFENYDTVKTGQHFMGVNNGVYPLISNNKLFWWLFSTGCFDAIPVMTTSTASTGAEVNWAIFDNNEVKSLDDLANGFLTEYWETTNEIVFHYDLTNFLLSCKASSYSLESNITSSVFRKNLPTGTAVSIDSFDIVIKTASMSQSSSSGWSLGLIANNKGKQMLKLLRGLGYNPCAFADNDHINFLPLMCLAKALFCMNAIQQEVNWSDSAFFRLMRDLKSTATPGWNMGNIKSSENLLDSMCNELITYSFFTKDTDSWNLLRSKPNMSGAYQHFISQSNMPTDTGFPLLTSAVSTDGNGNVINISNPVTGLAIQTALKLTKFFNSGSIFGQKISAYLKSRGYDVDETMFADTPIIYDKVEEVSINEVFSNSDTYDGTNGSELGAYAGRGLAQSKSNFDYTASKDGMLILWYSIIPRVGYCLATSPYLYNVNQYTWKDSMWDGLGYEISPCATHEQNLPYSMTSSHALGFAQEEGFGYQPRLTIWKQVPDLLNGDMALYSNFNTYLPYHDEMILQNKNKLSIGDWIRKPWMSVDYNRFFYSVGQLAGTYKGRDGRFVYDAANLQSISYDNFIVQGMIRVTERNQLKPLSESYDTLLSDYSETESELQ